MTGASYSCHVTLLILLLVLRFAFANINTPSMTSSTPLSSSPTSLSPYSTQLSSGPSPASDSQSNALSFTNSQSDALSFSNSQSGHEESPQDSDNTPSPAMPSAVSMTTSDQHQKSPQHDLMLSKRAKFHLTATQKEQKMLNAVEKLFLKNIGLEARPRISSEFAVPEYMFDLYNAQTQDNSGSSTCIKAKGNGVIAGNTVRSFVHTDSESSKCQPPYCSRVYFDITNIPEHEKIAGAELRIYVDASADTNTKANSRQASSSTSSGSIESALMSTSSLGTLYRIEVHEIMRPDSADGDVISRLLDTQVVSHGNSTWYSFDVRPAVQRWSRGDSHNHGLEIKLVAKTSNVSANHHFRLRRSAHVPEKEWALQRPLLVIYSDDGSSSSSKSSSSSSIRLKRLRRRKRQTASDDSNKNNKRNRRKNKKKKRRRNKKGNKNICQRHGLYVNFNDVGWDDWIVAPTGYNAYYCQGDCMAPLPYFTKASNHAILQARVYKVNSSAVPMVCCVPTKMSPISMLYRDEKGRTVLKKYMDMAVDECSCK